MVHCGSIRQTASITEMSAECLRTGDKARVKFRFVKHPEYLQVRPAYITFGKTWIIFVGEIDISLMLGKSPNLILLVTGRTTLSISRRAHESRW